MTYYNITITIKKVESDNLEQLENICEMMKALCNTVCYICPWETIKRYDPSHYKLKEVKE